MPRSAAKLRLVEGKPLDAIEPEAALGELFERETAALRELSDVRAHLALARQRYAAKHRLLVWPSLDTLRRLFA